MGLIIRVIVALFCAFVLGSCRNDSVSDAGFDAASSEADADAAVAPCRPLFSFDFTFESRPPEQQVALLGELGFAGIASSNANGSNAQELVALPQVSNGEFQFLTALWWMSVDQPLALESLSDLLPSLAIGDGFLWLAFGPGGWPTGATVPDDTISRIVQVADLAAAHGVDVVLYPHDDTPLTSAEQAVTWLQEANRPNLRVSLHLSHELKAGNRDRLSAIITAVAPHLAVVTIHGADREPEAEGWSRTIQPLDRGDLDVNATFVQPIFATGYDGPFVLHTFGLTDPPEEHLSRSMATWRTWTRPGCTP